MRSPVYPLVFCLFAGLALSAPAQSRGTGISGILEWDKMEISAQVSLDLGSRGLTLPTGRTQAEELITTEYLALMRPLILSIPVDSSSFVGDHIAEGNFSLFRAETYALSARINPPAMSVDMSRMQAAYTISLRGLSAEFIKHSRPSEPPRVLASAPAAAHTGILIIAGGELPLHGARRNARILPCLFPKIWDTNMNLIYDKTMLESRETVMVHYTSAESIFRDSPSGLSPELTALVGDKPLRILARGVYGIRPTDPIIDAEDARIIISGEENRRLLREGKVVIVL
ncbi:MAG: polymerase, partial [Treponema sp.]|nr:polymerase [Treponema sp.]